MKTRNMIIIPQGNLSNMVLVMLSAIVFSKHKNMNIFMIWKHKIPFDNLFLNCIELVDESFLNGKKYLYNPSMDQSLMYNNVVVCDNDEFMVIETNNLIKANTMYDITILKNMQMIYKDFLREKISGILLGQINMIDFPKEEFIYDLNDKQNNVLKFETMFDTNNQDFIDYIKILSISKASIVKCNDKHIEMNLSDIYHMSMINFNTIVCENEIDKLYIKDKLLGNYTENFLGYRLVINPNIQKMMLLL